MKALLSTYDKSGLVELASKLASAGYELVSTGGTATELEGAGLTVQQVSDLTGFPEILDGRVKSLHPVVYGGILARRDLADHVSQLAQHGIEMIDVVVSNLYPFVETVSRPDTTLEAALENIDPALDTQTQRQPGWAVSTAFLLAGLACIVGGGTLLVNAAVTIAREFGMSETLVGLTIVAVGTSLPELVTSAVAALRKQSEVALGNVLGSNIYNVLFIGGVTGTIAPTTVPQSILGFDLPLLIAVSLGVMVLAWTGARISRIEGLALVAGYALYIAFTAGLI